MNMTIRPRRLRSSETLRRMVRETRVDASSLIYPIFVKEGTGIREEIPTMPGQYRYSVDRMGEKLQSLLDAGVSSVMFFGIPDHKDEVGSEAYAENGIVQRALRQARRDFPGLYLITDVCMCEYTSHGHCGVLCSSAQREALSEGALRSAAEQSEGAIPSGSAQREALSEGALRSAAEQSEGAIPSGSAQREALSEGALRSAAE
ncbi:MAG: porphobilinogen synthase, partial [Lachnospiraceae bacterium]|nr:porphobilinogen synthase [Lachnospiraceae bacterium]